MADGDDFHPDEAELFRSAVGPVRRLEHDRAHAPGTRPPPQPLQTRMDQEQVLRDLLSDQFDPAELETGEELAFARPGVQHGVLRRLRRGQFSVEQDLDLHGFTVTMAREALLAFLQDARRARNTCVRVIHGKGRGSRHGQPVLKKKVNAWLRQRDEVLAFCSARPVDGGTGAVYVLLRRG
jgi:DNA-nicking Smr family endonuclease